MTSPKIFNKTSNVKSEGYYATIAYTLELFRSKFCRITNFPVTHANREVPSEELERQAYTGLYSISLICTYDTDDILI
jgi:hypothetical protein